jgi:hypothetical protein
MNEGDKDKTAVEFGKRATQAVTREQGNGRQEQNEQQRFNIHAWVVSNQILTRGRKIGT